MTTVTATKLAPIDRSGIVTPQAISKDTELIKVTKEKCLLPEERKTLQAGRNIAEAQRILTLKTARESAVRDILDLGQDVTLEEAINELSKDNSLQPLNDGVSFASLPLEEGLFATKNVSDIEDLKLAAARAALRKYVTLEVNNGVEYYQEPGVEDSKESSTNFRNTCYDTLFNDLQIARNELAKIKKQAGII